MKPTLLGSAAIGDFDGINLDMLIRQGFRPVPIARTQALTPEVLAVELSTAETDTAFAPGAHVELALPLSDGPVIRHYSLVGIHNKTVSMRIAILRETDGRGGSAWLHKYLPDCTALLVRGPRDTFGYLGEGPAFFVAGGIGITPITAMAADAAQAGIDWHLLYIGRRLEAMAFTHDLIDTHGSEKITIHITEEDGRPDIVALAQQWATNHSASGTGTTIYTCGPAPLMHSLRVGFADDPNITVISEDFDTVTTPDPVRTLTRSTVSPTWTDRSTNPRSAPTTVAGGGAGDLPFVVELGDGAEVNVPSGCSIIDALGAAGVRTLSSCQKGTCGTCETVILDGEADHHDSVLSPEEHAAQETMMICVSRARGNRITLDL